MKLNVNSVAQDSSSLLVNITPNKWLRFYGEKRYSLWGINSSKKFQDREITVSYEIESLFTNVPIDGASRITKPEKWLTLPPAAGRASQSPGHIT